MVGKCLLVLLVLAVAFFIVFILALLSSLLYFAKQTDDVPYKLEVSEDCLDEPKEGRNA